MITRVAPVKVNLDGFLRDLTTLCRRYRIGVADEPRLYVMDWEDTFFDYSANAEDRLVLGQCDGDATIR